MKEYTLVLFLIMKKLPLSNLSFMWFQIIFWCHFQCKRLLYVTFNKVTASNKFTHIYFYFWFVFITFPSYGCFMRSGYTELLMPPFPNDTFLKSIFIHVSECKYEMAESRDIIITHSKNHIISAYPISFHLREM